MKRIVVLTALLAIALQAYAQHFDPEHRHSIEISSGIPPIHCSLLGTHSGSIEMDPTYGYRENSLLYSVINIGYTYAISEKWDFNFVFNLWFVIAALLLFFLSYIFRCGEALQREADETL